jgi:hypothetical protein
LSAVLPFKLPPKSYLLAAITRHSSPANLSPRLLDHHNPHMYVWCLQLMGQHAAAFVLLLLLLLLLLL